MMLLFDQEESVRRYGNALRAEGERIGEASGEAKGLNLFGKLISCLLSMGRNDDMFANVQGEETII